METDLAQQQKRHAHDLIERLAPEKLSAVVGVLEVLLDPEEASEERAVDEAKQWLRDNGGKGIPHEEVLADFGLTADDFERMGEQQAQRRR